MKENLSDRIYVRLSPSHRKALYSIAQTRDKDRTPSGVARGYVIEGINREIRALTKANKIATKDAADVATPAPVATDITPKNENDGDKKKRRLFRW
jgi:hypothetical protein